VTITILHTNDLHGYLKATSRLLHAVQMRRTQQRAVVFVDTGDFFRLKHYRRPDSGDQLTAWVLRQLGYDAVVPGNCELSRFDPWHLDHLIAQNVGSLVCIRGLHARLPASCHSHVVHTVEGRRLLFMGICTAENHWAGAEVSTDFYPSVRRAAAKVQSLIRRVRDSVDLVVLLSHSGMAQDMVLAEQVPDIDLILSAHCHHPALRPVRVGKTHIVQAGLNGMFLGQIEVDFGEQGPQVSYQLLPIDADSPADGEMEMLLRLSVRRTDPTMLKVLGTAGQHLGKDYLLPNGLGNTITDLWRQATGADVCFTKATFVAPLLSTGSPITRWDLQMCLGPHWPSTVLTLTGEQVRAALEHSVADQSYLFLPADRRAELVGMLESAAALPGCNFLHQSGLHVTFDLSQPVGDRVREVRVGDRPLRPEAEYRVATDAFHADGGSGFTMLLDARDRQDVGTLDVVEEHLRTHGVLEGTTDDRSTVLGATQLAALS